MIAPCSSLLLAAVLYLVTVLRMPSTSNMSPCFSSEQYQCSHGSLEVMPSCLMRTSPRLTDLWIYYVWIVCPGLSRLPLALLFAGRISTLLETYGAVDGLWSWAIFPSVDATLTAFMPATRIGYHQAQPQLDTPICSLSFVVIQSSVALQWPHLGKSQRLSPRSTTEVIVFLPMKYGHATLPHFPTWGTDCGYCSYPSA